MAIRVFHADGSTFDVKLADENEGNTLSNLLRKRAEDWVESTHSRRAGFASAQSCASRATPVFPIRGRRPGKRAVGSSTSQARV